MDAVSRPSARPARIANLDVQRGVAILFILYMNINYAGDFANPDYFPRRVSWTAGDQAAWWVNRILDGTQRGLLELLFGAGIIILARSRMAPAGLTEVASGVSAAELHLRRNLWLMAFGVFHGLVLLWPGDILLSYGTAAILAFAFRTLRARQLLVIGIVVNAMLIAPNVTHYLDRVMLVRNVAAITASQRPPTQSEIGVLDEWRRVQASVATPDPALLAADRARVDGGWASFIAYNQQLWVIVQFADLGIYFINVAEAFGTMLIGMALFKVGVLQGNVSFRTGWLLLLAGYGIGFGMRIPAITQCASTPCPTSACFRPGWPGCR